MSAIIAINENNAFTVNRNVKCSNMNVVTDISCVSLNTSSISCQDLDINNINITGDIYVSPNQSYMPVGGVCIYSGVTAPTGWLLCDGSAINRTTYSRLFNIINTSYGSGNGTTTFNLPNLQERIPVGKSNDSTLGAVGGNSSITLSTNQLPSHTHTGTTDSNGNHSHTGTTSTNGDHTHGSNAIGGQDNLGLCTANGNNTVTNTDSSTGELNVWTTPYALSISNAGDHSHTLTIDNNGTHSHTFTSNPTGNGEQIDIRNKFIVMNYIIRF